MTLYARHGSHGPSELTRLQRENERLRALLTRHHRYHLRLQNLAYPESELHDDTSAALGERSAKEKSEMSGQVEALHREIALLRADLKATLRAVLYHFGPDGAYKVCTSVIDARAHEQSVLEK